MNSRPRDLGEMPGSTRLETVQTVAPVRTISRVGMEFSCALEKLICLRVIESYFVNLCGVSLQNLSGCLAQQNMSFSFLACGSCEVQVALILCT